MKSMTTVERQTSYVSCGC